MSLGDTIGNDVSEYPQWLLIFASVIIGLLGSAHIFRYIQTATPAYLALTACLICLFVQYILATQGTNASYLTAIADSITIIVNTMLLAVWAHSMRDHISKHNAKIIRTAAYGWQILFIVSAIMTLVVAIYDGATDDTPTAVKIIWWIALGISIVGNLILFGLTVVLQVYLGSEGYEGKRRKRLQLARLSLLFALLVLSKFGTLFEVSLLDLIPYLLFHIMLTLTNSSITGYSYEPGSVNV
jgi:hypothetical protein